MCPRHATLPEVHLPSSASQPRITILSSTKELGTVLGPTARYSVRLVWSGSSPPGPRRPSTKGVGKEGLGRLPRLHGSKLPCWMLLCYSSALSSLSGQPTSKERALANQLWRPKRSLAETASPLVPLGFPRTSLGSAAAGFSRATKHYTRLVRSTSAKVRPELRTVPPFFDLHEPAYTHRALPAPCNTYKGVGPASLRSFHIIQST